MKNINQAYHLLASVLPRAIEKASPVRDMPGAGRPSGFADMVMRMKKRFWKQSGRCRPAGPAGASCRTGAAGKTGMSGASGKAGGGAGKTDGSGRAGASVGAGSARNKPPSGAAGYSRPHAGAFAQKSRPASPHASFEQIITPLCAGAGGKAASGRGTGTGKRFAAKAHAPYAGFVRYMELKNRVRNRDRFQDRNHSTRVEKISRIRPVGRVERD